MFSIYAIFIYISFPFSQYFPTIFCSVYQISAFPLFLQSIFLLFFISFSFIKLSPFTSLSWTSSRLFSHSFLLSHLPSFLLSFLPCPSLFIPLLLFSHVALSLYSFLPCSLCFFLFYN